MNIENKYRQNERLFDRMMRDFSMNPSFINSFPEYYIDECLFRIDNELGYNRSILRNALSMPQSYPIIINHLKKHSEIKPAIPFTKKPYFYIPYANFNLYDYFNPFYDSRDDYKKMEDNMKFY